MRHVNNESPLGSAISCLTRACDDFKYFFEQLYDYKEIIMKNDKENTVEVYTEILDRLKRIEEKVDAMEGGRP